MRRQNTRRLSGEMLENRLLMAGDVDAFLSSDRLDLNITGDSADNDIVVEQVAPTRIYPDGGIRVSGNSGTTVNGRPSQFFPAPRLSGTFDDIRIDMGDGDDEVNTRDLEIDYWHHSDLIVDLGPGDDVAWLNGARVGRSVKVDAGGGDDDVAINRVETGTSLGVPGGDILVESTSANSAMHVLVDNSDANNILVYGNEGRDDVLVIRSSATNDIRLEAGDDDTASNKLEVNNSDAGDDIRLYGGASDDRLIVSFSVADDDVYLDGGAGDDILQVLGSTGEDVFMYGRAGNDFAQGVFLKAHDYFFASLGDGEDTLTLDASSSGRHYFSGGSGRDLLDRAFWYEFMGSQYSFEINTFSTGVSIK